MLRSGRLLRYSTALACVALAGGLRLGLGAYVGSRHPYTLFYLAVLAAAVFLGVGPALFAILGSVLVAEAFTPHPFRALVERDAADVVSLGLFVGLSLGIVALSYLVRISRERVETHAASLRTLSEDLESRVRDRTEKLRAAGEQLEVSERRLSGVFESAMDAILLIGDDERIAMANPAAAKMLGVQSSDIVGLPFEQLVPFRVRARHRTNVLAFAEQPDSSRRMGERGNITVMRPDGSEFPVEVALSKVEVGGRRYFTVVMRDITERLDAQRAVQTSKAQLEAALTAGGMATWSADLSTRRLQSDDANLALWGRTREEFGDGGLDTVLTWVHPDDRQRVASAFDTTPDRGGPFAAEFRIVRADGAARWLSVWGRLDRDESGVPVRYHGITTDITDRKRAEEERLRSQKLESLGTLAGGIAHDFNNILLAISGNAYLTEQCLPDAHPARKHLDEIYRATERAAQIAKRILAFSRPHDVERKPVWLPAVVDEALGLLRATVPSRIDITRHVEPGVPAVVADAGQLHQVVVNLATNAAHAISSAGSIDFSIDGLVIGPESTLPGSPGLAPGSYGRLTVRDSGCGMNAQTLERVFDPFFTTKPVGAGTGLGLSVVHGIVRALGGAVTVRSEPGRGSTFEVYLPAAAPEAVASVAESVAGVAPAPNQGPAEPRPGRGQHVLYVDDEPVLVSLTEAALKRMGYRVTGCSDPVEALRRFQASPAAFDVVVTDLSMPVLPGFELVRQVRASRAEIPVLMTSGFVRPEDEAQAEVLGVRAILLKPQTLTTLLPALDEIFRAPVGDSASATRA